MALLESGSSALRAGAEALFEMSRENRRPSTGVWSASRQVISAPESVVREIFETEAEGKRAVGVNDAAKFVEKFGLAVGGEAHHFVFVAKFPESEILGQRGVIHAERMRKGDFAEMRMLGPSAQWPTWSWRNRRGHRRKGRRRFRTAKHKTRWRDARDDARYDEIWREWIRERRRKLRARSSRIPAKRFITCARSQSEARHAHRETKFGAETRPRIARNGDVIDIGKFHSGLIETIAGSRATGNPAAYFTRLRRSSSTAASEMAVARQSPRKSWRDTR